MLFNSYQFMIFFPLIFILYLIVPRKIRYILLLVASYYFYMSWNPKYIVLILTSTIVTWIAGICIEKTEHKKLAVIISFVINLSILFVFKYFNFAIDSLSVIMSKLHMGTINNRFDIILPVGISFYTFQALGYTIDVYRSNVKAEKNFFRYALFVSFFPQLVAGPIERSGNLLTQLNNVENIKIWDFNRIRSGAFMMLWGFFLKLMIADRLAVLVDNIFGKYFVYGSYVLILGAIAFSLQIYCDFASYSTIAIGAAQVMGFTLMENFDTPYFAMSIKEFWRRWHVSLSSWFRDYLYIPLGGNRKGKVRKYINIMITFLVSGLWHGANWTYVFWGGLHGIYQIIGELILPLKKKIVDIFKIDINAFSHSFIKIICTFILTTFAWIFFRADSILESFAYIGRMCTKPDPWVFFDSSLFKLGLNQTEMFILSASLILLIIVSLVQYIRKLRFNDFMMLQNGWFQFAVFYLMVTIILVFGEYGSWNDANAFIYFQF